MLLGRKIIYTKFRFHLEMLTGEGKASDEDKNYELYLTSPIHLCGGLGVQLRVYSTPLFPR